MTGNPVIGVAASATVTSTINTFEDEYIGAVKDKGGYIAYDVLGVYNPDKGPIDNPKGFVVDVATETSKSLNVVGGGIMNAGEWYVGKVNSVFGID